MSGLVAGLLSAGSEPALRAVAGSLVAGTRLGGEAPPWPTAADQIDTEWLRAECPGGLVDLGMAHGVAGAVAALALAVREDVAGPDGPATLEKAAGWLAGQVALTDGVPIAGARRSRTGAPVGAVGYPNSRQQ